MSVASVEKFVQSDLSLEVELMLELLQHGHSGTASYRQWGGSYPYCLLVPVPITRQRGISNICHFQ
jgi:hypothetical protein